MHKIELHSNGFIIKAIEQVYENYLGVEGNCWGINDDTEGIDQQEGKYLYNYCSENIDVSWSDDNFVDASSDLDFINRYVSAYLKTDIKFEVLFCETNKSEPTSIVNIDNQASDSFIFIGFDYAYSGGSFYSSVFNDIHSKRIPEFLDIELNNYGLINSEDELSNFIKRRFDLSIEDTNGIFEGGDFTIYKLWKYAGDFPIQIR